MFKDKRFGEYNTKITPEEKMIRRFALERQVNIEKTQTNKTKKQTFFNKRKPNTKAQGTLEFLGWECPLNMGFCKVMLYF